MSIHIGGECETGKSRPVRISERRVRSPLAERPARDAGGSACRGWASSSTARSRRRTAASSTPARPRTCPRRRQGARSIDCDGRWITPGLIDCHTHLVHARQPRAASSSCGSPARPTRRSRAPAAASSRPCGRRARRARTIWSRQPCRGSTRCSPRASRRSRSSRATASTSTPSAKMLRAARRLGRRRGRCRSRTTFLGAHALPPECERRQGRLYRPRLPTRCCRPSRPKVWPTRSTLLRGHRLLARRRPRASSRRRRRTACRSSCMPSSLSNLQARRSPRASARCRPTTSNIPTRPASRRWRRPARSPCCCPAPSTSCARRKLPPIDAVPRGTACRWRSPPTAIPAPRR